MFSQAELGLLPTRNTLAERNSKIWGKWEISAEVLQLLMELKDRPQLDNLLDEKTLSNVYYDVYSLSPSLREKNSCP